MLRNGLIGLGVLLMVAGAARSELTKIGEVLLDPSTECRGVAPGDGVVYASLHDAGVQVVVDVTNPFAPLVLGTIDPSFGDQWEDSLYFEGFLFSGHRGGGLNMIDVADPAALAVVDSMDTNYHHTGLEGVSRGGRNYLFYSDHIASGGLPGGVAVFDTTDGALDVEAAAYSAAVSGRDLVVADGGDWVYQVDSGNCVGALNGPSALNVYEVEWAAGDSAVEDLTQIGCFDIGFAGSGSPNGDALLDSRGEHVYVAQGEPGLRVVSIADREAPEVVAIKQNDNFRITDLALQGPTVLLVSARNLVFDNAIVARFDVVDPASPRVIDTTQIDLGVVYDLKSEGGFTYVCGEGEAGGAYLQIWL